MTIVNSVFMAKFQRITQRFAARIVEKPSKDAEGYVSISVAVGDSTITGYTNNPLIELEGALDIVRRLSERGCRKMQLRYWFSDGPVWDWKYTLTGSTQVGRRLSFSGHYNDVRAVEPVIRSFDAVYVNPNQNSEYVTEICNNRPVAERNIGRCSLKMVGTQTLLDGADNLHSFRCEVDRAESTIRRIAGNDGGVFESCSLDEHGRWCVRVRAHLDSRGAGLPDGWGATVQDLRRSQETENGILMKIRESRDLEELISELARETNHEVAWLTGRKLRFGTNWKTMVLVWNRYFSLMANRGEEDGEPEFVDWRPHQDGCHVYCLSTREQAPAVERLLSAWGVAVVGRVPMSKIQDTFMPFESVDEIVTVARIGNLPFGKVGQPVRMASADGLRCLLHFASAYSPEPRVVLNPTGAFSPCDSGCGCGQCSLVRHRPDPDRSDMRFRRDDVSSTPSGWVWLDEPFWHFFRDSPPLDESSYDDFPF